MMIDVSIIIINYNTFKLTCKCIESIFRFTSNINYEIILVDNASTEADPEEFRHRFPEITIIKNKVNLGFSKGNNEGIKIAKGNTLLLLNSDTEVIDNVIGDLYKTLHNLLEVGVITCKLIYPDGRIQYQCGRFPSIILQIVELFRVQKLLSANKRGELMLGTFFDHDRSIYPEWIWGTFFMFKKEILQSFNDNKLRDTYFMYMEDLEWCYLIQKAGYKIFYDARHSIIHHFSGSSLSSHLVQKKKDLLRKNFRDCLIQFHGRAFTNLYFSLQKLNIFLHQMKG